MNIKPSTLLQILQDHATAAEEAANNKAIYLADATETEEPRTLEQINYYTGIRNAWQEVIALLLNTLKPLLN